MAPFAFPEWKFPLFAGSAQGLPQTRDPAWRLPSYTGAFAASHPLVEAGGRGTYRVIHMFHRQMGRKMAGPDTQEVPAKTANPTSGKAPPGHFLNSDLESDTARFLAELKESIRRREELRGRLV